MSDEGQRVTLADRITPVFLRKCGPEASEAEIAAFEESLGYRLPNDYREFLWRFNGGYPIVTLVNGRDDDPTMPYSYGDCVQVFYKLQTTARAVADSERLQSPGDAEEAYGWGLPADALHIGRDAGGNMFVMELGHPKYLIRFVDHERLDEPFETHRVIAEGFTDLLMRFRTVEEQGEEDRLEYLAERERMISGAFSDALEIQCHAVEQTYQHIRQWIREACLEVFEDKGYFSLHDDARSRMVLDLAFWLRQTASAMIQVLADVRAGANALQIRKILLLLATLRSICPLGPLRPVGPDTCPLPRDDADVSRRIFGRPIASPSRITAGRTSGIASGHAQHEMALRGFQPVPTTGGHRRAWRPFASAVWRPFRIPCQSLRVPASLLLQGAKKRAHDSSCIHGRRALR
jgi:hypothetical protein